MEKISSVPNRAVFGDEPDSHPEVSSQGATDGAAGPEDGFETDGTAPQAHSADGIDTNSLTSTIALIGSLAGTAAATTVGGLVSGVAGGLVAVIKGVEALAEDHKKNGNPNNDPMKMDRPIDKK
jgi:hypothetical protein